MTTSFFRQTKNRCTRKTLLGLDTITLNLTKPYPTQPAPLPRISHFYQSHTGQAGKWFSTLAAHHNHLRLEGKPEGTHPWKF